MLPSDYRRIESELLLTQQQQFRQTSFSTIQSESLNRKGWSAGYLGNVNFTICILCINIQSNYNFIC